MKGDSGSLLVSLNPQGYGILGIVAGFKDNIGLAIPFPIRSTDELLNIQEVVGAYNVTPFGDELELNPACSEFGIADHLVGYDSGALFLGSVPSQYRESKSNYYKSIMYEEIAPKLTKAYEVPILRSRVVLDEVKNKQFFVDPLCVAAATLSDLRERVEPNLDMANICYNDYIDVLREIPVPEIKSGPLSLDQALNSAAPFSRLKMSTSAGYPMKGKKNAYCDQYLENVNGVEETKYKLKPDILVKFNKWMSRYAAGIAGRPVFTAHKKDEIKSAEKIAAGRERMFNGSPFFYSLACRKYIMPILVFIQENASLFEHAVGINCMSPSWAELYDTLKKYKFFIHGDFGKFDQEHLRIFLLLFNRFCMLIVEKYLDYTPEDKSMVFRLINDGIFAAILLRNDLYLFPKGFVSGHIMTIFINCFITSMYIRLAWFTMCFARWRQTGKPVLAFRLSNFLKDYGDDNFVGTNDPDFTFRMIRDALAIYGLEYTSANKEKSEVDFFPLEEIQFLKRTFKEDVIDGHRVVLCPIEEDSIWKSLAFVDCDKSAELHQLARNLVDAHKQYWFFGRTIFEEKKDLLKGLAVKYGILIGDEDSSLVLKWFSFSQLSEQYFSTTMNIFFT